MSLIYPYRQKPPAGTFFDPKHEQVQDLGFWVLMDEGMGLTVRNLVDPTGDTDGRPTNIANPPRPSSGWGAGQFGSALAFDGDEDHILTDFSMPVGATDPFTVMLWVYTHNNSEVGAIIEHWHTSDTGRRFRLLTGSGDLAFRTRSAGAGNVLTSVAVSDNEWTHIACAYDGSTQFLYKNAILADSAIPGALEVLSVQTVIIGALFNFLPEFFDGVLDDIRIANRAFDQSLIEQSMNDPFAMFDRRVFFDVAPVVGFAGALVNAPRLRSTVGGGLV